MTAGPTSTGFGEDALDFFEGLAADNGRTYWQARQATYQGPRRGAAARACRDPWSKVWRAISFPERCCRAANPSEAPPAHQ
jgi:hypothetical protein